MSSPLSTTLYYKILALGLMALPLAHLAVLRYTT